MAPQNDKNGLSRDGVRPGVRSSVGGTRKQGRKARARAEKAQQHRAQAQACAVQAQRQADTFRRWYLDAPDTTRGRASCSY